MAKSFSPSVNIIRDQSKNFDYVLTPNAERVAGQIEADFKKGTRSFTLIGSYGTGKSSFLLALDQALKGQGKLKISLSKKKASVNSIRVVGVYQSLISYFQEYLGVEDDFEGNQKVLDKLNELSEASDLLVIYLDEFGKFLEYGTKHHPEKELYFLQQLAELANAENSKILLLATLHQSFEAYGGFIVDSSQKAEWKKVKGRFKELTFNEPVEQLLHLAAHKLNLRNPDLTANSHLELADESLILPFKRNAVEGIAESLAPLDVISASLLARALQSYGQNERSLFTFLESEEINTDWFSLSSVYDYLLSAFYGFLFSSQNPHLKNWQAIQSGIERAELAKPDIAPACIEIVKTVGLIQLFGSKKAQVNEDFLRAYFGDKYKDDQISDSVSYLERIKVITYAKYLKSYRIIEGTDVDFDLVLTQAEDAVDRSFDLVSVINEHFSFPYVQAKEASYKYGTPRLFAYRLSDKIENEYSVEGALDGYIHLVFDEKLTKKEAEATSKNIEGAILIGVFENTESVRARIYEILKTKKVLIDNRDDHVARHEFERILESHERLLSHEVLGAIFTKKVSWYFNGKRLKGINGQKDLNKKLSEICDTIYPKTPRFDNELLNKHKISTSIHTARKNYFKHLCENWNEKDLGFVQTKYPPERTIYQSLLLDNGMHTTKGGVTDLAKPNSENGFDQIWEVSTNFLRSTQQEKKPISELWTILSKAPFKLKLGLIDFWVPTFLFVNRGDFALYEDGRFVPHLNDSVLYLMTRQPHKFEVKSFELSGLRLKVFNKYRELVDQEEETRITQKGFIDSVRPFLIFYKSLNDYQKNTSRLSHEAIKFRSALVKAKDPETTFFDDIPKALGIDITQKETAEENLMEFAAKLNDVISELKESFELLLERVETYISVETFGKKITFSDYKQALIDRYESIDEHRLIPKQKIFVQRLCSPLNDRDSWLISIGQAILGKSLDKISDDEEQIFRDSFAHMIQELDNLLDLQKVKVKKGERVVKLNVTNSSGMLTNNVRISSTQLKEVESKAQEISMVLSKNKKLRLAVLAHLIEKELEK